MAQRDNQMIMSYSTDWKPSCTTLDLLSPVALLSTQLMEYGRTRHTVIWLSFNIYPFHNELFSQTHIIHIWNTRITCVYVVVFFYFKNSIGHFYCRPSS